MKKYLFILFLGLFACELIVDVDVPFDHPQLTVNSFFNQDSTWFASLTLNRHILNDTPFQSVDNAFVVIYREGSPVDTLIHQGYGRYKSATGKPLIGIEYELRAIAEPYESVTGRSQIPVPEQITHIELIKGDPTADGRPNNSINLTFKDNSPETNYYQILMETEHEFYDSETDEIITARQRVTLESNDPAIQDDDADGFEGILLKDALFNGKEVKLSFKTPNNDLFLTGGVIVSLRTVSKDYYNYKTTFQLQNNTSGDPFAQPVNVHNNIANGFGIFAGFGQSIFNYEINPKPIITGISPLKGQRGDHIIISGKNFIVSPQNFYSASFKGNQSRAYVGAVRSTESEIEVIIPDQAITGKIVVYMGGRVAVSDMDFEVTN